jgi:plastocyanin
VNTKLIKACLLTAIVIVATIFVFSFSIMSPFTTTNQRIANAQSNPAPTSPATTAPTAPLASAASSSNKILYLFTAEHQGVNQTKLGIPPDTFSPDILEVNTGDNVTIHFYNLDLTDSHTFTIGAPYNTDKIVAPGQNATFKFKAAEEGIYRFYCRLHLPTMEGQLIVLPTPPVEKTTTATVTK